MDNGLLITLICVLGGGFIILLSSINKRKSPDQKYKEKQEREKSKKEKHREKMKGIIESNPALKAIEKKRDELDAKAMERIKNDEWSQDFLLEVTKETLLKKTKQRLINIAKKDLKIEIDPSLKKNEIVEKIYVDYHNLNGWDSTLKDAFK